MKQLLYLYIAALCVAACGSHRETFEGGQAYSNFRGFVPIDPIEYKDQVVLKEGGAIVRKEIKMLSKDQILEFLNNETVLVSIGELKSDGQISYLPVTVSAKHSSYKVTMDYMKFATLPQMEADGTFIGFNRVGVGLRLITLLTTQEAGINIGDLSTIGLAVKTGKAKGTLMIEVVGIKSKDVTTLLPLPSEINLTTIQNAMQALATIKSKVYDSGTELFPQVLAIKPDSSSVRKPPVITDTLQGAPTMEALRSELKLQIGTRPQSGIQPETARKLEQEGFDRLLAKDVSAAITAFGNSEAAYPGYHSVYEIRQLLQAEAASLANPQSPKWKEVYRSILDDYAWKLSPDVMAALRKASE